VALTPSPKTLGAIGQTFFVSTFVEEKKEKMHTAL